MEEVTPVEDLDELIEGANEFHKMERLIKHIKNPEYMVMWIGGNGYYPFANYIKEEDNELRAYLKETEDYIDLYNVDMDDIKVYDEINFNQSS